MNKCTDIPLGKDVYCTDGLAGRSSHLILNPLNRRATHLVVRKRRFPHSDHVVPMELVAETNRSLIRQPRWPAGVSGRNAAISSARNGLEMS